MPGFYIDVLTLQEHETTAQVIAGTPMEQLELVSRGLEPQVVSAAGHSTDQVLDAMWVRERMNRDLEFRAMKVGNPITTIKEAARKIQLSTVGTRTVVSFTYIVYFCSTPETSSSRLPKRLEHLEHATQTASFLFELHHRSNLRIEFHLLLYP